MATDARIALAGKVTDVAGNLSLGQQTGERFRTAGVREQILDQQAQEGQQTLAANQGAYMNQLATNLKSKSLTERAAIAAQQMPYVEQMGGDPSVLFGDLSDTGLDSLIAQTQPFMQQQQTQQSPTADMQNFQFYNSILENPNSTEEEKRQARIGLGTEAKQGRGQLVPTNVPGVVRVFDSTSMVMSNPMEADASGQLVELTPQQQLDNGLMTEEQYLRAIGGIEEDIAVSKQGALAPGELEQEQELENIATAASAERYQGKLIADRTDAKIQKYSTDLQRSNAALPKLAEAFEYAQAADQGLSGAGKLFLSKFPGFDGVDVTDEAGLQAALTNLALNELQKFPGTTTDFEYGVTKEIAGSLMDSKSANLARIASLRRANWFLGREAEQFNNWIDQDGNPDKFAFNYEEIVNTKRGDFSLKLLHQTAARNHITMDELLTTLNATPAATNN